MKAHPDSPLIQAVSLYALAAGTLIYLICIRQMDHLASLATALSVLALPAFALWARQVQLDVPAIALLLAGLTAGAIAFKRKGFPLPVRILGMFCVCSWIFFSVVSNKDPRFNLPSVPFLFIVSASGLYLFRPRLAQIALPVLAAWLVVQVLLLSRVEVVSGFKEAALVAQAITPRNRNVLISAHRDGSFIYNMRTAGNRRDIGVRRADKIFVEINIMRELGIRDNKLDQKAILDLLEQQNVSTIVAQTAYLSDQSSMRNFQQMLDAGVHFERVRTIALRGATGRNEQELVVFRKR